MNEEMSDLVALFVLGMCTFYSVWLSMDFSRRSKLHLLWTIPIGFFGCFVALAIFSLAVSQANDFLFIAAASALFLPFPIWRLYKLKNSALPSEQVLRRYKLKIPPLPPEQAMPKDSPPPPEQAMPKDSPPPPEQAMPKDSPPPPEQAMPKDSPPPAPLEPLKKLKNNLNSIKKNKTRNEQSRTEKNKEKPKAESRRKNNSRKTLGRGNKITFAYTNAKDETAMRHVRVTGFDGFYIKGVDLDKRASRTFRTDRIIGEVIDTDTGEVFYL